MHPPGNRQHGYAPSNREIAEACRITSKATVTAALAALEDQGYIKRTPRIPRGIALR